MAKKGGSSSSNGKRARSGGEGWSSDHHALRKAKQQRKVDDEDKQLQRERRSALLTRDSKEKHEEGKLRLHITRTQRQLEKLKQRLETWDDVEEARLVQQAQEEEERKQKEAAEGPKKKRGRLGPETWKLKGAARPAWQVYDFDTRYVDPHQKAHDEAARKVARSRNILATCQGRFGRDDDPNVPQPHCREYLSLLMQLGLLSMQSNQLKTARKAFLECIDLDGIDQPVTPARCHLMRLYLEANRPESARRLWERLSPTDPSVWIRYSAALIEYVSWKILEEEGSTQQTAEALLASAIKSNIFCAYYLAFFDLFRGVMEHTDEIEDADESSPLEEAIEYCNSEQLGAWKGTEGAMEWIQQVMKNVLNGGSIRKNDDELTAMDLDWRGPLAKVQEIHSQNADDKKDVHAADKDDDGEDREDEEESAADVAMFATMFETAMEMLEDSGRLK
jgi:tetratricopeptide (TPR) repeat protein